MGEEEDESLAFGLTSPFKRKKWAN